MPQKRQEIVRLNEFRPCPGLGLWCPKRLVHGWLLLRRFNMKRTLFLMAVGLAVFSLAFTALAEDRAHKVFAEGGLPTG